MHDCILPNSYVAILLPSETSKVIEVVPDAPITLGKYGVIQANQIIGRPYYLTFEIPDQPRIDGGENGGDATAATPSVASHLRVVSTAELNSHLQNDGAEEYEIVGPDGAVVMRTNRDIFDDGGKQQRLTTEEIELLKRGDTDSGRNIIAALLDSHSSLDKKTHFSLAKYTLRKTRKYIRRFTVLPLDPTRLCSWLVHDKKDGARVMDLREETLALACSWADVHSGYFVPLPTTRHGSGGAEDGDHHVPVDDNRWLVVDDTGGLVVAAMAERMGLLYPTETKPYVPFDARNQPNGKDAADVQMGDVKPFGSEVNNASETQTSARDPVTIPASSRSQTAPAAPAAPGPKSTATIPLTAQIQESHMSAQHNTITVVHANTQANLSLLSYFSFSASAAGTGCSPAHPLHTHLKTLSWLQLLHPTEDATYRDEPAIVGTEELATWKSGRRGMYHRKRRRWARTRAVVDDTRTGGFAGLVVASTMPPAGLTGILHHLVPLIRGGGRIVAYSPTIEPLAGLADAYSKERRAAYLGLKQRQQQQMNEPLYDAHRTNGQSASRDKDEEAEREETRDPSAAASLAATATTKTTISGPILPSEDFPLDPTLLLAPTIHTARARAWQVLPGRTHPKMTGKGGAEGYVFVGTRVLPSHSVEARGTYSKKRKTEAVAANVATVVTPTASSAAAAAVTTSVSGTETATTPSDPPRQIPRETDQDGDMEIGT